MSLLQACQWRTSKSLAIELDKMHLAHTLLTDFAADMHTVSAYRASFHLLFFIVATRLVISFFGIFVRNY